LIRHLYHEAGKTQRYGGLNDNEALSLITINPAKQLGIENRVGSIEVGKDGDVVIFNAHPLSIYAIPQFTLVDGVVEFNIAKDIDDQRIDIDPSEKFSSSFFENHEEGDKCMQGVSEQLHKK
jgi:cytosine/adenosine deaminase-related metal-dependent hydrolase